MLREQDGPRPSTVANTPAWEGTMALATIDAKGRVAIPAEIRKRFGLQAGDAFFFDAEEDAVVIRMAKAVNLLDILADHAIDEHNADAP